MKTILIQISPLSIAQGVRIPINIADGPSPQSYGIGGQLWYPAVVKRPKGSMDLFSPDMDGTVQVGTMDFTIALNNIDPALNPKRLYWDTAPVTIWSTNDYDLGTATLEMVGYISTSTPDLETGDLDITATVSTALIEKPLLTGTFTGANGINGDPGKRGSPFPCGYGRCNNIQPVWFDTTNNIGMLDGYGNLIDVIWMGEGLSSMGGSQGDYPTYEALVAAIVNKTVAPGQWATCNAQGLVGLGAPAQGVITVHANFGGNRPGAMMKGWLGRIGVPAALINTASFDAIDVACPYPVHYWTDAQVQVSDLMVQMCASINASPLVSMQGVISVSRAVRKATPDITINRAAQSPPLPLKWEAVSNDPPYYLVKARASRPVSVLTIDQVNYGVTLTDRGTYNPLTVYSNGDIVWDANGAAYLYFNPVPAAGVPLDNPEYWSQHAIPPVVDWATQITGANKPEDGATKGAPSGTPVGPYTDADDVYDKINFNASSLGLEISRGEARDALIAARTLINGVDVATLITTAQTQIKDGQNAFAELVTAIGASDTGGSALQIRADAVEVTPGLTLNTKLTDMTSTLGSQTGDISTLQQIIQSPGGTEVKAILKLTSDNYVTGITFTNDGSEGAIAFLVDKFQIVDPNQGQPMSVFSYQNNLLTMTNIAVDTIKVGTGGSVQTPQAISKSNAVQGQGTSTWISLLSVSITLVNPGQIMADAYVATGFPSGDKTWNMRLLINGATVYAIGGQKTADSVALGGFSALAAGTYVVEVQMAMDSTVTANSRLLKTLAVYGS